MSAVNRRSFVVFAAGSAVGASVAAVSPSLSANAMSERSKEPAVSDVPKSVVDRYGLNTNWYGKYIDAWGVPVLGSRKLEDATLLRARAQLGTLLWTYPWWPVPELIRRKVRVVIAARGELMSCIPEINSRFGTDLDVRYWGGMGATDSLPLSVGTEANLMDNTNDENVFVHEFGHTLMDMALAHIDTKFSPELQSAWDAAMAAGRWSNTYAGSSIKEYWAEGTQSYFDVNRVGLAGGDGIHNDIGTRAKLKEYDSPLFTLLDRVFCGASLKS